MMVDRDVSPVESEPSSPQLSPKSSEDGSGGSAQSVVDVKTEIGDAAGDGASAPMQKRRRVTRACDECRRKKIKCDGKQPCTHCSVYTYECTYDKPSNRRRNPAPQYIEALENRLQRAETMLRKFMPDADLSDPSLEPAVQQEFRSRERARIKAAAALKKTKGDIPPVVDGEEDEQIRSMIETIGQLDLREGGEWDFHGSSSGAVFLQKMRENFRGALGQDSRIPFFFRPSRPPGLLNLDHPGPPGSSSPLSTALANCYDLPPKEVARNLCYFSLNCATCLLRIVHVPSFYEMVDKTYEKRPGTFSTEENRFLALLYAVMALGCMYDITTDQPNSLGDYQAALDQGMKYYSTARLLLQDITECRDLVSLQALLFMILFLQATSNLSACYSFLGIANRAALRMGLHRHLPHAKLTPIEYESRRRVFYVTRMLDIYVSALLGFPLMLRDEDIDQPLPTEVDDEYITKDQILTPPPGSSSFFEAFNAHATLMNIMKKVVEYVYPPKGLEESVTKDKRGPPTYMISYSKIKEIEGDLQEWFEKLPIRWRPSSEGEIEVVRVRTLLRFAYAHVQMLLYRPFLHYVSPKLNAGKEVDERYYACAAAGISVSRNIVHIGMEIRKQTSLIGPYWFILYTQYFAILALVFYALENPDKAGSTEIMADAIAGREVIHELSKRSMPADRVNDALTTLFDSLPDNVKKGKGSRPIPTKKRSAPGSSMDVGNQAQNLPMGRRSEDLARPHSQLRESHRQMQRQMSFDTGQERQVQSRPVQQQYMSNHDLLPLDIASATGSPASSGTPSTSYRSVASFPNQAQQGTPTAALYELNSMMFPSGDPFAYPARPAGAFKMPHGGPGGQHSNVQSPASQPQGQHPDQVSFFMPNMYDDIEGQLLGPVPPYLLQSPAQAQQGGGVDLSSQMYDTSTLLTLQQGQAHHHGVTSHQGSQLQAQQQRQQREMQDFMVDPSFGGYGGQGGHPHGYQRG